MAARLKQYVLPYLPYVFMGWFCLKLGTAYRLAPGEDFGNKLINTVQMIGPAFESYAPGLAAFDWLVGVTGAVLLRLVVYYRVKNAKTFRKDEEYGSARWSA